MSQSQAKRLALLAAGLAVFAAWQQKRPVSRAVFGSAVVAMILTAGVDMAPELFGPMVVLVLVVTTVNAVTSLQALTSGKV